MTITAWDEPTGGTPRGTLIVLPGRGETAQSYARFGKRISADAWKVRVVPVELDDLDGTRARVEKVLADATLPGPKVLVGSDSGATLAARLAETPMVDAVVLAGLAFSAGVPVSTVSTVSTVSWDDELEARSACPVHRSVLSDDPAFERGALNRDLPWAGVPVPAKPTLVLHGRADVVTPVEAAITPFRNTSARVRLIEQGRHDVLNDATHRVVAATIILFLESLRLGPDLPDIVTG